jgi:hypothetical protein
MASGGNGVSGLSVAVVLAGSVLAYSGVKGYSVTKTIGQILNGQTPSGPPDKAIISVPLNPSGVDTTTTSGIDQASSNKANQALGKLLAAPYGWATGDNWNDLISLWNKESGWSNTADTRKTHAGGDNASSTVFAYGIAQARPANKYPKLGQPSDLGGISDPASQIRWGLNYIKQRYGNPIAAWQHEVENNWY